MKTGLKTERLWLRLLEQSDGEALTYTNDDFEVSKWLAVVHFSYGLQDAHSFIVQASAGKNIYGIIFKSRFFEVIGLGKELVYWLAFSARGQGLITEAADAVVSAYFENLCCAERKSRFFQAMKNQSDFGNFGVYTQRYPSQQREARLNLTSRSSKRGDDQ